MTLAMIDAMLCDRSTSYRKLRRLRDYGPPSFRTDWADAYRRRRAFSCMLQYLKKEGFVERQKEGRNSYWHITVQGKKKLSGLKKSALNLSTANLSFEKPQGKGITVFAFDIPERERKKRDWLRQCLIAMEFRCLQKSVWVSRGALSEKFMYALREREMLSYIHIFSITKRGTIREI